MNVLMLVLYGIPPGDLFTNESLVNIRHLKGMGAFGLVEEPDMIINSGDLKRPEVDTWEAIAESGKSCLWIKPQNEAGLEPSVGEFVKTTWEAGGRDFLSGEQLKRAGTWMNNRDWGACLVEDHGLRFPGEQEKRSSYLENLDQNLGKLFESIGDETLVAVLIRTEVFLSGFILAAPFAEPVGEVEVVSTGDVAATLMYLCGLVSGESISERLILHCRENPNQGDSVLSMDEETILRERLSGLGYL